MKKTSYLWALLVLCILSTGCKQKDYHAEAMNHLFIDTAFNSFVDGVAWESADVDESTLSSIDSIKESLRVSYSLYRQSILQMDQLYAKRQDYCNKLDDAIAYLNVFPHQYNLAYNYAQEILSLFMKPEFKILLLVRTNLEDVEQHLEQYSQEIRDARDTCTKEYNKLRTKVEGASSKVEGLKVARDYINNDKIWWKSFSIMTNMFEYLLSPLIEQSK